MERTAAANVGGMIQTKNVRILRDDPNSMNKSSQYVSYATVNENTAVIFEDYKKGRIGLQKAQEKIDQLSAMERTEVPFSVYLNVHANHASVFFFQTDLLNRTTDDVKESQKLTQMNFGIRVFFCENSFQIINPLKVQRVDLFTTDGMEYKIEINSDILKPGVYNMFKCFETIGISNYDIEWSYLMAAQDWYDTAANNCLSFSKRIIREFHRHIMGEDVSQAELKKLNKLYISVPGEASFENFRSRLSLFLAPSLQPFVLAIIIVIFVALYVEIRMRF